MLLYYAAAHCKMSLYRCVQHGLVGVELMRLRQNLSDSGCVLLQAAQVAGKWFIEKFLVHGLIAAISLPMTVLSVSSIIDAQWSVVSSSSPPSLMTACPSTTARSFSVSEELRYIIGGSLWQYHPLIGVAWDPVLNMYNVSSTRCSASTVPLGHTIYASQLCKFH